MYFYCCMATHVCVQCTASPKPFVVQFCCQIANCPDDVVNVCVAVAVVTRVTGAVLSTGHATVGWVPLLAVVRRSEHRCLLCFGQQGLSSRGLGLQLCAGGLNILMFYSALRCEWVGRVVVRVCSASGQYFFYSTSGMSTASNYTPHYWADEQMPGCISCTASCCVASWGAAAWHSWNHVTQSQLWHQRSQTISRDRHTISHPHVKTF